MAASYRKDVQQFIDLVRSDPTKAVARTKVEVDRLKGILTLQSFKTYLSHRRVAVKEAFGTEFEAEPAYLEVYSLLKLPTELGEALRAGQRATAMDRHARPIQISNTGEMVACATMLLDSRRAVDVILGLGLVTGRRMYEIAANPDTTLHPLYHSTGQTGDDVVSRLRDRWHVWFTGQVKAKPHAYAIPVLADSNKVIAAFELLRGTLGPHYVGMSQPEFNATSSRWLGANVKKHFGRFWPQDPEAVLEVRALRTLYGEIASRVFNGTGTEHEVMKQSEYLARILGHRELDPATVQSATPFVLQGLPVPPVGRPLPDRAHA